MADFNFNIKLGVDDSEVMKSIRRLDAESKRISSRASQGTSSPGPGPAPRPSPSAAVQPSVLRSVTSKVDDSKLIVAVENLARTTAASLQKGPDGKIRTNFPSQAVSAPDLLRGLKGWELVSASDKRKLTDQFTNNLKSFFNEFNRELSKVDPSKASDAARDLLNKQLRIAEASNVRTQSPKMVRDQVYPNPKPVFKNRGFPGSSATIDPLTGKPFSQLSIKKENARISEVTGKAVPRTLLPKDASISDRLSAQFERSKVRKQIQPKLDQLMPEISGQFDDKASEKITRVMFKKLLMQFPETQVKAFSTFSKTDTKVFGDTIGSLTDTLGLYKTAGSNKGSLALRRDLTPQQVVSTLSHEFGHAVDYTKRTPEQIRRQRMALRSTVSPDFFGPDGKMRNFGAEVLGSGENALRKFIVQNSSNKTLSVGELNKLVTGNAPTSEAERSRLEASTIKKIEQANRQAVSKGFSAPFQLNKDEFGQTLVSAKTSDELFGGNPVYERLKADKLRLAGGLSDYGTTSLSEAVAESFSLRGQSITGGAESDIATELIAATLGKDVDEVSAQLDKFAASVREVVANIDKITRFTGATGPRAGSTGARTTGPVVGPTGPDPRRPRVVRPSDVLATGPTDPERPRWRTDGKGGRVLITGPTGPQVDRPRGRDATDELLPPKASGPSLAVPPAPTPVKRPTAATGSTRSSGTKTVDKAEKDLVKSLDNKSKALDRQTDLLKKVYADFAKAERALISSLNKKASAVTASAGTGGGKAGGGGGGGRGRGVSDPFGSGDDEENISAYEAAAKAAAQRKANMEDIGEGVRDGGGINDELIQDSGVAEAYAQYINALIEAAAALERENLGLVKEIAEAKAQAALYNQKLANQVLALQNADPAFIGAKAENQVLNTEQGAAVGAAAQAAYGPRLADADVLAAQTRAARRSAALEAAALRGVDTSRFSRKERRAAASRGVANVLVTGDEAAIARERKSQLAQVQKGVEAAVKLNPKDALDALKNIKKQLRELQGDIKDDVTITINDAAATAVLQNLGQQATVLEKKIADLQKIGKNTPQNLSTALDPPAKDTTSKELKDLKKRANLIGSNVKDAASLSITDPKASTKALRSSEAALSDLDKERKKLVRGAGGLKNLNSQQRVEYDSLTLAIKRVTEAQRQLNFELKNPAAVKAASRLKEITTKINREQVNVGKIAKEKDPALRAQQLADLDARVKALQAEAIKIDTSVDPQAALELSNLKTQIDIVNSRRLAVASGAAGGGGSGGGGTVVGGAGGASRGRGQRGDIVSRVRGLGGAAGFFGSGALSTLRYSIPSAILFGAATGISSSIKEAEQLQFNLSKIESQIQSTFGDDAEAVTQQFKKQIMDISLETGLAADELALLTVQLIGAFSTVGSIEGMSGTDLVNAQIESAAKIAQSTGLPLAEITDGLTAASIAFNASFQKIGDVAIALEQKSGVLAKETISFIGDIAPVATEAGFSLEEFAALAALAQQRSGRGGAALAEQFGRIIPAIYQSRQALLDIAITNDKLGTPEFITAINKSDTRGILFGIGEAFNSLNKESKDFIVNLLGGRREAAAILPALSNPQALQGLSKAADDSAGKLEERFKKVQATLTNTFQRLNEQVRKLFLTLLESGLEDVLKDVAGLLGIIAKGFGLVFKAVSPVLGAFDGLPVRILAAVAAFKLLRAATRFGPGGGVAGIVGGLGGNTGLLANMRANALQRQAVMGTVSSAQRAQMAALFNFMSGTSGAGQYGINPRTGTMTAPGMLGGNFGRTGRQAYADARAAGQGRLSALGAGFNQRSQNVDKLNKAGLQTPGQKASAAFGGLPGLALTGVITAYSLIQAGVEEQNANLDKIKAFADDANTSIADLEAKARDLREVNAGISIGARLSGFFTGARYESEAEYAQALAFAKSAFDENEQRILDILGNQQAAVNFFLERISGLSGANALPNVIADEGITAGGIDINPAGNVGVGPAQQKAEEKSKQAADKARIKTGTNKGKFNVEAYIRNAYAGEGRLGDSRAFQFDQDLADAGDALRAAALERLTKISEALGFELKNLDGDIASALGSANPTKALEEIVQDKDRKYTDKEQKQAQEVLNAIIELGQNDPRVKALLESSGLLNDAAAASLKSLEQLQKDLDLGRISPETYLAGLNELRTSILAKINDPKVTGDKKLLYEQLFNIDKTINGFVNEQAQKALTATLDIINLTSDPTTMAGIMQKAAAIQTAINSGLTGEDLRKAALELVQTQKEMAIAMIQNAATAEEAAEIAGRPIKIPIETRVAAIKGQLGTLVGNWSTFTKGWETAFGETADDFIKFITTALSNGSMSIDQVKAMMEKRKKDLETQRALYMEMTGAKKNDPTVQAYDQAISGANAIINSINTTGKLPGDTGNEVNDKKAQFAAYQQRAQAATNLNKAKANKDSVAKAMMDAQQAEKDYQKAVADGLDAQTLDELDAKRREAKQAVIDAAKAVADAVRGIAKAQAAANKDSVAQAVLDLDQANKDYQAAVAAGDKEGAANAVAAQIAARAALRDNINNRARTFAQLLKALGSQDSLDQAQYDVNIARMNMANAVGPEERMQAWMELIAAERAQREAFKRRREAMFDLAKAQTEDPVQDAQYDLTLAQQLIAEAKTNDERIAAQKQLIDAQRAMTNAMNDVRNSQFTLRQAELAAIGDDIGAAQVAAAAAREQLAQAINAGKGAAEINNLRAGVISAEKAARDAIFQGKLDEYKYLLDTDQITKTEYANYLEGLKSTLIPGTKQFKDLEVTIKNLKDDISGNLQTNLPTSLMLPTLYEVRRLNQSGQFGNVSGGANGPSVGYQDNRNIQVQVVVNNGMSESQVVDSLAKAMNVGTSGLESRRY